MDKKRARGGELALQLREDDFNHTSPGGGIYEHLPQKPVFVTHDFHSFRQSLVGTRVSRVWGGDVGGGWGGGEERREAEVAGWSGGRGAASVREHLQTRLFSNCEEEIPKSPRRSPPSSPRNSHSSHRTRQVCGSVLA